MSCCRHKQLADAGVRRAQELQQRLVAAQHQVQLQCLQLAQQEAQLTTERQRVRAAQAEQIQRLSGKASSGCGCMSLRTQSCRYPPSVNMSPQGLLYRILQDLQAKLHYWCSYLHLTQVSGEGPSQARLLTTQCCLQLQARWLSPGTSFSRPSAESRQCSQHMHLGCLQTLPRWPSPGSSKAPTSAVLKPK